MLVLCVTTELCDIQDLIQSIAHCIYKSPDSSDTCTLHLTLLGLHRKHCERWIQRSCPPRRGAETVHGPSAAARGSPPHFSRTRLGQTIKRYFWVTFIRKKYPLIVRSGVVIFSCRPLPAEWLPQAAGSSPEMTSRERSVTSHARTARICVTSSVTSLVLRKTNVRLWVKPHQSAGAAAGAFSREGCCWLGENSPGCVLSWTQLPLLLFSCTGTPAYPSLESLFPPKLRSLSLSFTCSYSPHSSHYHDSSPRFTSFDFLRYTQSPLFEKSSEQRWEHFTHKPQRACVPNAWAQH